MNQDITAPRVRLIDSEGKQLGEVDVKDALRQAEEADLDLVEVSPNAKLPVCRIMDYGKHLFQQSKKSKTKSKKITVKQVNFRPGTEEHDYNIKLRKLEGFLRAGNKVKAVVRFRGREMQHQELGLYLLERLQKDLEDCGVVEQKAKVEGRQGIMVLGPLKGKTKH